ncbi:integration host factor subunit beta [mine drainage metagenome]|uniref:Integration host factor subunit beta n=1 Tax=mine drainage metagenome TaxID=410659 RepID=A0A1J5RKV5_9ZZZZ
MNASGTSHAALVSDLFGLFEGEDVLLVIPVRPFARPGSWINQWLITRLSIIIMGLVTLTPCPSMTRAELIQRLAAKFPQLTLADVDISVKAILDAIGNHLSDGGRVEIRGFGVFSLNYKPPRRGRNPKTGEIVAVPAKYMPHFKPGREMKSVVSDSPKPNSDDL